jgi:hypothetical protein
MGGQGPGFRCQATHPKVFVFVDNGFGEARRLIPDP